MPASVAAPSRKDLALVQRASSRGILEGGNHPIGERLLTAEASHLMDIRCV
jgi:hypothetical protein